MAEGTGDFLDLRDPWVTIVDVPALFCDSCGTCRLRKRVIRRLSTIVVAAFRHAERRRLREVTWSFTPQGPPVIGGMPTSIRDSFATLREVIAQERRKVETIERLVHDTPMWFH